MYSSRGANAINLARKNQQNIRDTVVINAVKQLRGRPKGSTKPFWHFSGKSRETRKKAVKEPNAKKQKTADSDSDVISVESDLHRVRNIHSKLTT